MPHPDIKVGSPSITVTCASLYNLDWLGGGKYNLVQVTVPVTYQGELMSLCLVMFEDRVDPIVTGREELGYPKIMVGISNVCCDNDNISCSIVRNGKKVSA